MIKYFCSSDVHSFYTEWMLALASKGFDINNPEHKIIVCGDLFDRGDEVIMKICCLIVVKHFIDAQVIMCQTAQ